VHAPQRRAGLFIHRRSHDTAAGLARLAAVLGVLLAGVSLVGLALAAALLVRGRGGVPVRLFGRVLHRPRLWAAAVACLALSGLLRTGGGLLPGGWHGPRAVLDVGLSVAFVVLLSAHLASEQRARRRH
jgi:hypothetical protein